MSPQEDDIMRIQDTYNEVFTIITNALNGLYENFTVLKYGSTVNGLAVRGEFDLDLTVIIYDSGFIDHYKILRKI